MEPHVIPPPDTEAITAFGLEDRLSGTTVNGTVATAGDDAGVAAAGVFGVVLCGPVLGVVTACGVAACAGALCDAGTMPFEEFDELEANTAMFGDTDSAPV